jgi:hypothetical protein
MVNAHETTEHPATLHNNNMIFNIDPEVTTHAITVQTLLIQHILQHLAIGAADAFATKSLLFGTKLWS